MSEKPTEHLLVCLLLFAVQVQPRRRVFGAAMLPVTMVVGGLLGAVLGRRRGGASPLAAAGPVLLQAAAAPLARAGEVTWNQQPSAS